MKDAIAWLALGAVLGWALSEPVPAHSAAMPAKPDATEKLPERPKPKCFIATTRQQFDIYPDGRMVRRGAITIYEAC